MKRLSAKASLALVNAAMSVAAELAQRKPLRALSHLSEDLGRPAIAMFDRVRPRRNRPAHAFGRGGVDRDRPPGIVRGADRGL